MDVLLVLLADPTMSEDDLAVAIQVNALVLVASEHIKAGTSLGADGF